MTIQHRVEQSRLRILQVSTADRNGGAEGVAWNLFQAYRNRWHESWLTVGRKDSDDPDVIVIPNQSIWGGLCQGLQEQLKPFEENVRGVWRVREQLETWSRWSSPWRKMQRSLGE